MTTICNTKIIRGRTLLPQRSKLIGVRSVRMSKVHAVASAADQTQQSKDVKTIKTWYALVASAEFMLNDVQNEAMAEQLREKKRYYEEKGEEIDFFFVCEPAWLEEKFPQQAKQVGRPCLALVSADKVWSRFMQTRLDRVLPLEITDIEYEELVKCGGTIPEFDPPAKWLAPYSPYTPKWWEVFMPGKV
eukprot:TRINITY_DN1151_c0_g1_i2.p2 TRINITY_DN1151_c0_g1~~TRINITY_DN1151_c0_g1_i2.p2  ORF type:complete len:202 (+),score=25.47 TRINITY_DN1151_c0_g1_i2:41-607(+)